MKVQNSVFQIHNYVTIRQASLLSDRSEGLIRRKIQDGKLRFIKVGYSILIPVEGLEKLKKRKNRLATKHLLIGSEST